MFWIYFKKAVDKVGYTFFIKLKNFLSNESLLGNSSVVVSLTSYGARVNTVFYTIESIGRGSIKPKRITLWIQDQNVINNLPPSLERLKKRGLEVLLSKNYGPHTKYYPYVKNYYDAKLPLVTADDDIFYPKYWLKYLLDAYKNDSTIVSCYRAHVVTLNEKQDMVGDFYSWAMCRSTQPSFLNHATGCSGVIYPPILQKKIAEQGESFMDKCPKADDIWLHVNAIRNGFKIKQIYETDLNFTAIPLTQKTGLKWDNIGGKNDEQAKLTYTENDLSILKKSFNGV
ncbi:MAG: hypothetical protein CTY27_04135 [Methylotenera sp.]|nr:MAG: hypothetical protein CTY27_04135 [Methylotenera sp.]